MAISRKDFLHITLTFGGVSAAASLLGCGSDPAPAAADTGAKDTGGVCTTITGTIAANHGHTLLMPLGDLTAAGDKTYDIAGAAGHSHSVTFTEAQRKDVAAGKPVTVTATTALSHSHEVSAQCG